VTILFLLGLVAPLIHLDDSGPGLFRMFAGGTAVLFGAAYLAVWRDYRQNRQLLIYGTVLKYWAFAISLYGFLSSRLSLQVLLSFGGGNLIFAMLFTYYILRRQQ
jgi:peptidoglycan/LPS O-acetylase OafA/YrhL